MAADNIKITASMFDWSGSASVPYEASVYSANPYTETPAAFDLMDYLLDDSLVISWDFEYIREGYNSPKLLPMGSQVSLRLSNMDGKTASFFRINRETALIKWKVKIFYDNALVHEGWVSPEGISYDENAGKGSETHSLEVRIKDTISEIKDYFSNVRLKSNHYINWTGTHTGSGARTVSFGEMLSQNFPGVLFSLPGSISEWRVMETPQIYLPPGTNVNINPEMWLTSYERAFTAEENRYDWLRRICNDMGWVIYSFVNSSGNLCIGIKDRADSDLPLHTLDINRMTGFSRTKELNNNDYDVVMIINGVMDGGDAPFTLAGNYYPQLKGARLILISKIYDSNYEVRHWDKVVRSSNGSVKFYWQNHKMIKYASEDENNFRFYRIEGVNNNLSIELINIPQEKILRIDHGSPNPYAMKLITDTGENRGHTIGETPLGHFDMVFMGCYGEMLTKEGKGYSDYVKSDKFRANFEPFLSHMERHTVSYFQDKLLLSPNHTITGGGPLRGFFWDISSMEIDLINETTSFELISHKYQYSQQ